MVSKAKAKLLRSGPRFLDSPVRWIGGMENGEKQCREHARLIRRA